MMKACIVCGDLSTETRCDDHRLQSSRGTARERGYDRAWDLLSARARRLQPFCSDAHLSPCSGPLTVDHLPSGWERKASGLPLRLVDVDPVCDGHNKARGSSRPGSERSRTQGEHPAPAASGPRGKAKFESENGSQLGGAR